MGKKGKKGKGGAGAGGPPPSSGSGNGSNVPSTSNVDSCPSQQQQPSGTTIPSPTSPTFPVARGPPPGIQERRPGMQSSHSQELPTQPQASPWSKPSPPAQETMSPMAQGPSFWANQPPLGGSRQKQPRKTQQAQATEQAQIAPQQQPRQQAQSTQQPRQQPQSTQQPHHQPQSTQQPRQQPQSAQHPRQQPQSTQQPRQQPQSTQQPRQQPQSTQQPQQQPQTAQQPRTNIEQISTGIQKVNIGGFQIPRRKPQKIEKRGKPIIVETNHFPLSIKNPKMVVFHYDVTVEPEKPIRFYRPAVNAVQQKCYPRRFPAFDGRKNLYSYPELPIKGRELCETVKIFDSEKQCDKEVKVTIKYANSVDISVIMEYMRQGSSMSTPQEAIQALDVVLRQPAANRFVSVGRSFFTPPPGQIIELGDGMDLWYGFFQSAIIGWKPFLNVDVAHKGFPSPKRCLDILANALNCNIRDIRNLNPGQQRVFLECVNGLKVVCEIPNNAVKRTYKVLGLSECARRNKFNVENRETHEQHETTVERYYFTTYNYQIRYPELPCLKVGSVSRPISVPLELCRIQEGQVTHKKLNENQTRVMIKEAAVDTDRRKSKIVGSMRQVNFNNDPTLREFGLSVAETFTKVPARILMAPTVDYKDTRSDKEVHVRVDKGVWRLQNTKFLNGAEVGKWSILSANKRIGYQQLQNLQEQLCQLGRGLGLNISQALEMVTIDHRNKIQDYFRDCEKSGVKLVVIVLPDVGVTYAQIKKMAELQVGILTQCIKSSTMRKLNPSTVGNLLLKINAKLNGVNHKITSSLWPKIFERPVMIVGADVTHPAPGSLNVPSIAAVAASHDPRAFRYNMIWKMQPPKTEVISELKSIIKEHLLFFYRSNNRLKPERILVYRDGVSEGQFQQVLDIELNAIRQACSEIEKNNTYQPKITFLVVQKRHHTRFFPSAQDADGRNKNVPAGTIVDSDITHPTELDFYLVSHASIQGTARPTKYHRLWDDSDLPDQELEEITYYLCHLFARCTRSVSIPAPTYYAHLAAFRARSYTETEGSQVLNLNDLEAEQRNREIKPAIRANNPMFFV